MEETVTEYRNMKKLEKQRLMGFTKGELVEELLTVYEHCQKLKNTSSNSEYTSPSAQLKLKPKCKDGGRHHWKVGYECAKCGLHRETFINWGRA